MSAKRKGLFRALALMFISILLLNISPMTHAHELEPGRSYRWGTTKVSSGVRRAYVECSDAYLNNSVLSPLYSSALSHWTNNSGGKAEFVNTSFSASNCDFVTPSQQYWPYQAGLEGIVYLQNSSGQWKIENYYGSNTGFNSGDIVFAVIWFNPSTSGYNTSFKRTALIRHEMGHVLGLGHTDNSSTASIMYQYLYETKWDSVQDHDRADLASFYP